VEIEYFINLIKSKNVLVFTRGQIIDYIADNGNDWVFALKALLIKNSDKYIFKSYLLEKLNFMREQPDRPYAFLDTEGAFIFSRLRL